MITTTAPAMATIGVKTAMQATRITSINTFFNESPLGDHRENIGHPCGPRWTVQRRDKVRNGHPGRGVVLQLVFRTWGGSSWQSRYGTWGLPSNYGILLHCHTTYGTRTVFPSMGMPGGTKGTEPVAIMMSLAVTVPPTSTRPAPPYIRS